VNSPESTSRSRTVTLSAEYKYPFIPHIERVLEVNAPGWDDASNASLRSAQNEAHLAALAWYGVAPADELLPECPTPLQRMVYTRMVTSQFIARMATFHDQRRRGGAVSLPRDAKPAAAALSRRTTRIYAA
jgi:hypothetical protein